MQWADVLHGAERGPFFFHPFPYPDTTRSDVSVTACAQPASALPERRRKYTGAWQPERVTKESGPSGREVKGSPGANKRKLWNSLAIIQLSLVFWLRIIWIELV